MEEEGDEASGFDDIRRIFDKDDEDEEEREEEGISSKLFDEVELDNHKPEDPKSDNGSIMQRYALLVSIMHKPCLSCWNLVISYVTNR